MSVPARASGWYADETDAALLRYWDGSGWTPHTSLRAATAVEAIAEASATALAEPALHRTVRLPASSVPDHTTVPAQPQAAAVGDGGTGRSRLLPIAGALTAAASLVVACAALTVALAN